MKKTILTILLFGILVLELTGCSINQYTNYSHVLKANWNIELPKSANIKEIYGADDGDRFHGDGFRYHIFSYEKDDEIKEMFNWSVDKREIKDSWSINKEELKNYPTYSEKVNNWLDEIQVPEENYPNYSNCKYWYEKQEDNSEIIILWDRIENRLYVAESFL